MRPELAYANDEIQELRVNPEFFVPLPRTAAGIDNTAPIDWRDDHNKSRNISDPVNQIRDALSRFRLLKPHEVVVLAKTMEIGNEALMLLEQDSSDNPVRAKINPDEAKVLIGSYEGISLETDTTKKHGRMSIFDVDDPDRIEQDKLRELLLELYAEGGAARRILIESNLRWVLTIASKHQKSGIPLEDLFQQGVLGLEHAVEKFEYRKGYKMSTYSGWWIRQSITRYIADRRDSIRKPVHMVDSINKLNKKYYELIQVHGRPPTDEELAEKMEVDIDKLGRIKNAALMETVSMDTPIGDGDSVLADIVMDKNEKSLEDIEADKLRNHHLHKTLGGLTLREKKVIMLHYGLLTGELRTRKDIGKELGVSHHKVRNIELKALSKLRHPSSSGSIPS